MVLEESWRLAKACFHVIRRDKEVLVYPAVLAVLLFAVIVAFIVSLLHNIAVFLPLLISIPLLVVVFSFLGAFFEAAVVGCAGIRLDGGDPRVRDGLKMAADRWWPLFKWALMGMAVGLILGFIRGLGRGAKGTYGPGPPPIGMPRLPPMRFIGGPGARQSYGPQSTAGEVWGMGDIIAGILGMAWSIATFFVIPAIVYEGLQPLKAIRRSWEIIKRFWKETLILKLGFGALFGLLSLLGLIPLLAGFYFGLKFQPEPVSLGWMGSAGAAPIALVNPAALIFGIGAAALYWIALACLSFAMRGILRAVLYKYSLRASAGVERACPSCGLKVSDADASFCPHCGSRLPEKAIAIPERDDEFKHINSFLLSYL